MIYKIKHNGKYLSQRPGNRSIQYWVDDPKQAALWPEQQVCKIYNDFADKTKVEIIPCPWKHFPEADQNE